jgi:hypothetical protein
VSTGVAGHDDRSSEEEVGRGEVAEAAGLIGKTRHGAEGVTGRVAVQKGRLYSRSRARPAVASPRSAGQASHRARDSARSGHFQALIGSRSSRNSPKSLHKISSLSFTLCFSCSA